MKERDFAQERGIAEEWITRRWECSVCHNIIEDKVWGSNVEDDVLKNHTQEHKKEGLHPEYSEPEQDNSDRQEYMREISDTLRRAVDGIKAKKAYEAANEDSQKSGFNSVEQMLSVSLRRLNEFRSRVGEERYNRVLHGVRSLDIGQGLIDYAETLEGKKK